MYGPITTLRNNNRLVRRIPWSAFKMTDDDWNRVVDARDILGVGFLFVIWKQKLTYFSGLKSYSTILLFGKTTHPLASPPCT